MTELPDLLTGAERFMTAAAQPIPDQPAPPPAMIVAARLLMLTEEVHELVAAYGLSLDNLADVYYEHSRETASGWAARELAGALVMNRQHPDYSVPDEIVHAMDALLDIAVVAYGGALEIAGIDATRRAADEVTRSNLAKIGADGTVLKRADGKVLKPIGWTAPDIAGALGIQQHPMPSFCQLCGGQNGDHGFLHNRYSMGGGGTNRPCPNTPNLAQKEN